VRAWHGDAEVDAWLVPINPEPRRLARHLTRVRYVRAAVSESLYLPSLPRELARADIVHVFSRAYKWFLLAAFPAIVTARALRRPVLLHYHHGEAADHLRRSAVARATLARVDRNVVPSSYLQEVFAGFGLRAEVVLNLTDLGFAYRERDPVRPRLLSTRNLDTLYNVGCTLRAFQIVQQQRPDATLTILGTGPQAPALRAIADSLGLSQIHFAGRIEPQDMPRIFDEHDIYIQSPQADNTPNSVIEAFASGLPVVATAVGGVPALTRHGELALLAPPDDHGALAAAVLRLLDDPALARRLARVGRQASEGYAWAHVRPDWLRTYRSMLTPSAPEDAVISVQPLGA
jgi:glycosyltransferase involved in cell wall biosynthesis